MDLVNRKLVDSTESRFFNSKARNQKESIRRKKATEEREIAKGQMALTMLDQRNKQKEEEKKEEEKKEDEEDKQKANNNNNNNSNNTKQQKKSRHKERQKRHRGPQQKRGQGQQ